MFNDEKTGGPAFPMPSGAEPRQAETTHYNEGMSLRDWFAGQALAGMMSQENAYGYDTGAELAYKMADAMLKVRGK